MGEEGGVGKKRHRRKYVRHDANKSKNTPKNEGQTSEITKSKYRNITNIDRNVSSLMAKSSSMKKTMDMIKEDRHEVNKRKNTQKDTNRDKNASNPLSKASPKSMQNRKKHMGAISIYYTNSRSLGNKINELRALACSDQPDFICITESWLNLGCKHLKSEFTIDGYKLFNKDRKTDRRGGGVAIYCKESISCCMKTDIKVSEVTETIWLQVGHDRDTFVLGVVYKSPNLDRMNTKIIYDEITKASRCSRVCIIGDFNYRNIDWEL